MCAAPMVVAHRFRRSDKSTVLLAARPARAAGRSKSLIERLNRDERAVADNIVFPAGVHKVFAAETKPQLFFPVAIPRLIRAELHLRPDQRCKIERRVDFYTYARPFVSFMEAMCRVFGAISLPNRIRNEI